MATTGRRISDCSSYDAAGGVVRRKSRIPRAGRNTRNVGVFAANDSRGGNISGTTSDESDEFEISLLSELLQAAAGDIAPQISRQIVTRYGRIAPILVSPDHEIFADPELPDDVRRKLRLLANVIGSAFRHEMFCEPVVSRSKTFIHYLHVEMSGLAREKFRVFYLDSANHLLRDQIMWEGSVNCVQVHPREIVRTALETGATALILAHNHPSGRCYASREDIAITSQIVAACKLMDIAVHDHLIVGRNNVFSMRQALGEGFGKPGQHEAAKQTPQNHRS